MRFWLGALATLSLTSAVVAQEGLSQRLGGPPAKAPRWTSEGALTPAGATIIQDYYEAHGRVSTLRGVGGLSLHGVAFRAEPERGAIVVVSGRRETASKYAELVYDLHRLGFSVFLLDHRGQGRSGRLLGQGDPSSSEAQKSHVDSFLDYVKDLKTFVDEVVEPRERSLTIGLGHSMGGAILARYALEHPTDMDALVLTSPMLGLPRFDLKTRFFVRWQAMTGSQTAFAKGKGPWGPAPDFASDNPYTSSKARYARRNAVLAQEQHRLGGPTYGWVNEAALATDQIMARAGELRLPILLFQAGQDVKVPLAPQTEFAREAGDCLLVRLEGAKHELLLEADPIRRRVLDATLAFLELHRSDR